MKKINFLICLVLVLFPVAYALSLEFRVLQIPNGTINTCANCHINPNGGGSLNPFGRIVFQDYLISGNVTWNADLAALDSDGDGFTNGEELQDPSGIWREGMPQPGDPSKVTLPGAASSKPTVIEEDKNNKYFNLMIYPNPFSQNCNIVIEQNFSENIMVEIYTLKGSRVRNLNGFMQNGIQKIIVWDGCDDNGKSLPAGQYLLRIFHDKQSITEKIFLIK